jgi:hypothetical protein
MGRTNVSVPSTSSTSVTGLASSPAAMRGTAFRPALVAAERMCVKGVAACAASAAAAVVSPPT